MYVSSEIQSLACSVAALPAFWFCTVTVKVKTVKGNLPVVLSPLGSEKPMEGAQCQNVTNP